nr:type II toxin-antitoxin system YoeB family toxin [Synergistes jonesii]
MNALIKDIQKSPYADMGKPEPLKGSLRVCGADA